MEQKTLTINNQIYDLFIHIEKRNSTRASITRKGINIRIPKFLSKQKQQQQIEDLICWAIKKIKKNPPKQIIQKIYNHGDTITIQNKTYTLFINHTNNQSSSAMIKNEIFNFKIPNHLSNENKQKQIKNLLNRCVASCFIEDVKQKIYSLNNLHFCQEINNIFLKNNCSNWGSCSHKKNINISTKLLLAPQEVLDYVCIHELAHLIEHNHSKNFWNLVRTAMPNYKEHIKWLKEHGHTLNF